MTGVPVTLYKKTQTGVDAFNNPTYSVQSVTVNNVLVGQPTTDEITSSISLYGKKIEYMLGIPKGDTNDWQNATVVIFNRTFRTFGDVIEGIEANIPTPWHKKVRVERCE